MTEARLSGTGLNATVVANTILRRAFREHIDISPMKLQKLLFFITCLYQRKTHSRLLTESFQPWKYGPVVRSVYDEFSPFRGNPITTYAKDATGASYAASDSSSSSFAYAFNTVWSHMKNMSAVELSRITHLPNSAWSQAIDQRREFISNEAMANDHTFDMFLEGSYGRNS